MLTSCNICGKSLATKGHSFGEWTITKEADEKTDGEKSRVCSACGFTETQRIPSKGKIYKVLMILSIILVLAGAGFGAYWFIFRKKKLEPSNTAKEAPEQSEQPMENEPTTASSTAEEDLETETAEDNN